MSQFCQVRARTALAGEKRAKMLGESDRERKLHDTSATALGGKQSGESFSRAFGKTRRCFAEPLKTQDFKTSENNNTHAFSSCKGLHKRLRLLKPRAQAGTQMRALCPPESTDTYPYSIIDWSLKSELNALIRA